MTQSQCPVLLLFKIINLFFSKFRCTTHMPNSVADFTCRVNQVKRSISYFYKVCFLNLDFGGLGELWFGSLPPPSLLGAPLMLDFCLVNHLNVFIAVVHCLPTQLL
jgi:hypothetical protein